MSERIDYPPRTRAAIDEWMERKDNAYKLITRCKDRKHSKKNGTPCKKFVAYEPIAGGDEYAEMPAVVEPDGFCKCAEPREEA